jgi:cell division protein FtsB
VRAPARRLPWRPSRYRRWLAVAVVGLVAFLYYKPLTSYFHARKELAQAQSELRTLETQQARLERRLAAQTSDATLLREARRLGYVKPGERLFIVKGIPEWRAARRAASSIGGDG